jgi:uncharacterized protein
MKMSRHKLSHKVFRDPIHSNIEVDLGSDEGQLALNLIDCPEVQRLRKVRQLALASLVYHGAEHSRFSHTLGVMHLASRLFDLGLRNAGETANPGERAVVIAAALLHDTGHPPFSHAVEKEVGVSHEDVSESVIRGDTVVHHVLESFGGSEFLDKVADHITGRSDDRTADLISSQLDADRLDYVLRDGYHAGVPNSQFDLARIAQLARLDDDGLGFDARAQLAIEGYLLARYHLYLQLYFHKTNRAGEVVLRAILRRARYLYKNGDGLGTADAAIKDLFGEDAARAAAMLTDNDLWFAIRVWMDHPDPVLADLCRRLQNRDLFKAVELDVERSGLQCIEEEQERAVGLAKEAGLDPDYYAVLDYARDTPYKVVDVTAGGDPRLSITLVGEGGRQSLEYRSGLVQQLQKETHQKVRLCVPRELRDQLRQRS